MFNSISNSVRTAKQKVRATYHRVAPNSDQVKHFAATIGVPILLGSTIGAVAVRLTRN